MTEVCECFFPQNTKSHACHCRAAERRDRAAVLSEILHYGPSRTSLEREVGNVFNPFLDQLSLQSTKPICQKSKQRAPVEVVPRTLQEMSYRHWRQDFPTSTEEMVLFAQFGKLFNLIGPNSKTEGSIISCSNWFIFDTYLMSHEEDKLPLRATNSTNLKIGFVWVHPRGTGAFCSLHTPKKVDSLTS